MQLPLTDPDTLFEELLQDLPPETVQMARAFKAFVRAKKVKTPEQLLRVVFLYCGLDKPLREVAGIFTALYESMTDQAVAERLRACGPWVKALLRRMLPMPTVDTLPQGLRFVVIDASSIQAPGATGTDHRLHIALDLRTLQFIEVLVSDVHTGETLKHFPLRAGDVAVADRGYAHAQGMSEAVKQGAELIVRLNPFSVVLCDLTGQPVALCATLKRQKTDTLRTLEVVIQSTCGQHTVRGWVHAYRLSAEQAGRARYKCRQRHKKGTPKAESLFLAGWVLVLTTLSPAVLSAQTIMTLYRSIGISHAFSTGRVHPPRTMLPGHPPASAGVCPHAQRRTPCWYARPGVPRRPAPPGATPLPRQRAAAWREGSLIQTFKEEIFLP